MSAAARPTYLVCIAGLIAAGIFVSSSAAPPATPPTSAQLVRDATAIAAAQRAQPAFVENRGQWHPAARYVASFGATTVFVEAEGWSARFVERSDEQGESGAVVRMRFVGAQVPELEPERKLGRVANFFLGNDPTRWQSGVASYAAVRLGGVYDGVDVVAYGSGGHFEYDVVLAPHAALQPVEVQVEGAESLRIDADGALIIETAAGPVRQPRPKTWEVGEDGTRRSIVCDYELRSADRFGFVAPGWNGTNGLVVDPGLEDPSFLGGSKDEAAGGIAVDQGIVTIAGTSYSRNYPTTSGAYQPGIQRRNHPDVVITRIDPAGPSPQILSSTYLGGSNADLARDVWVDGTTVTVYGITRSIDLPIVNAYDGSNNGGRDMFVSQFDITLGQLTYSTYLGGSEADGHVPPGFTAFEDTGGLWVSPSGVITVADFTYSGNYPMSNAYNPVYNSTNRPDAVVSQLNPSLSGNAQLIYSTFLGSQAGDVASAVHVDAVGIITVTGITTSSELPNDFPTTSGAHDEIYNGGTLTGREFDRRTGDVFVSRLDPSLTGSAQLIASTYLGGGYNEWGMAIDVDGAGNVWIAGYTSSDDFPTTPGAYSELYLAGPDTFVSKFNSNLSALLYSTMLGGSTVPPATTREQELIACMSVDGAGVVTIAGNTNSSDWPTTPGAYDSSWHGGETDCFVARLDPALTGAAQLVYSTFLGGALKEQIHGMHVDAVGDVTVVGDTTSVDFPTLNGFDSSLGGASDIFLAKLSIGPIAPPTPAIFVSPTSGLVTTEGGGSDSFDVVLATQPAAAVGIVISSSAPTEALVSSVAVGPAAMIALSFDGANWDQPQTVTVTGVDDGVEDGDVAYILETLPATSTDPNYSALDADDVAATNIDDDLLAPSMLVADNATATTIDLSWNDNSTTEVSFEIESSPGGAMTWNFVASVGVNVTSYTDTGLTPETAYDYRVRASKPGGNSAWSNIASETTLQGAAGVDITGIAPDSMDAGTSNFQVDITGTGFATGATVSFENGQGPAPNVSNVVVQSGLITADLSVSNGGPKGTRLWDVRVTNPDQSTDVLVDGFSVVK